jgi:hypothetical protein
MIVTVFDEWIVLLKQYIEEHKQFPKQYDKYKGEALGSFVNTQHQLYRDNKLDSTHIEKLEQVQDWRWSTPRKTWEESFSILQEYINRFNHYPRNNEHYKGIALGRFIQNQKHRKDTLSSERIAKLSELQGWRWRA